MTITDRIEINPKVMMGKPVIRGTRLTVELILRKLSEGQLRAQNIPFGSGTGGHVGYQVADHNGGYACVLPDFPRRSA